MNAAFVLSGEVTELLGAARAAGVVSAAAQAYAWRSHFQRRFWTLTVSWRLSRESSKVWNGRRVPATWLLVAVLNARASRSWSNAGARVRFAGSTMTNWK